MRARHLITCFSALVLAAGLVAPTTAADALRPQSAVAASVTKTFVLPAGGYDIESGLGSMWFVRADEFHDTLIYRVDPSTNVMHQVGHLKFPGAAFTVAYGSLWITDYFGNAVWRVSPTGSVQAHIATGLQPEAVHAAFGSVWIANHHQHSVTRVDANTNKVVATDTAGDPTQFRDGPQGIASDSSKLYVGSSNLYVLQSIDPATNTTTTPAGGPTDDVFCGSLTYLAGAIWNADPCSNTLYRTAPDGAIVKHVTYGPVTGSDVPEVLNQTAFGDQLWVSVDRSFDQDSLTGTHGVLEQRDPRSGRLLRTLTVGGDVSLVRGAFGTLWVFDATASTVRRLAATAPVS